MALQETAGFEVKQKSAERDALGTVLYRCGGSGKKEGDSEEKCYKADERCHLSCESGFFHEDERLKVAKTQCKRENRNEMPETQLIKRSLFLSGQVLDFVLKVAIGSASHQKREIIELIRCRPRVGKVLGSDCIRETPQTITAISVTELLRARTLCVMLPVRLHQIL